MPDHRPGARVSNFTSVSQRTFSEEWWGALAAPQPQCTGLSKGRLEVKPTHLRHSVIEGIAARQRIRHKGTRAPGPILRLATQPFDHRITLDIGELIAIFISISYAMIEIIILPVNFLKTSAGAFPLADRRAHSTITPKAKQSVQMVWHQYEQIA